MRRRRRVGGGRGWRAPVGYPTRCWRADDSGQITLLAIGFMVVALALVAVVASATAVHLDRKSVVALADLVALEAADALSDETYFANPVTADDPGVPLTDGAVADAVEEYLAAHGDDGLAGLRVLEASTDDGWTATVRLGAVSRPPLVWWLVGTWSDGFAVTGEAHARAS